jgi:hypothetical protein
MMILAQQDPTLSAGFETWAYRGVIGILIYVLGWLLVKRFEQQSKIWEVVQRNKETSDKALVAARVEFTSALKDTMLSFRTSLEQLNGTVKEVGTTLKDLQITIGREYATRIELKELRVELKQDIQDSKDA